MARLVQLKWGFRSPSPKPSGRRAGAAPVSAGRGCSHQVAASACGGALHALTPGRRLVLPAAIEVGNGILLPDGAGRTGPDLRVLGGQRPSPGHRLCNEHPVEGVAMEIRERSQSRHMRSPYGQHPAVKQRDRSCPSAHRIGNRQQPFPGFDDHFPIRHDAEGRKSRSRAFAGFRRQPVRIRQSPQQRAGVERNYRFPAQNASASSAEYGRSQPSGNSNSPCPLRRRQRSPPDRGA